MLTARSNLGRIAVSIPCATLACALSVTPKHGGAVCFTSFRAIQVAGFQAKLKRVYLRQATQSYGRWFSRAPAEVRVVGRLDGD